MTERLIYFAERTQPLSTSHCWPGATRRRGCVIIRFERPRGAAVGDDVELIDVDEDREAVFDVDGVFHFVHLRQVTEGTFTFKQVVIPEPGEYRLKLFVGGEFLAERELHVEEA
jgi:hypothetical protein